MQELGSLADPFEVNQDASVSYLHRTVKTFLETEAAQNLLFTILGSEFNPMLSVLLSYILKIERYIYIDAQLQVLELNKRFIFETIIDAMEIAKLVGSEFSMSCFEALNELRDATFDVSDPAESDLAGYQVFPLYWENFRRNIQRSQADDCERTKWNISFLGQAVTGGLW